MTLFPILKATGGDFGEGQALLDGVRDFVGSVVILFGIKAIDVFSVWLILSEYIGRMEGAGRRVR